MSSEPPHPPPRSVVWELAQKWFCAAVSAGIAETITMPLDVTKTRLQLQNELGRPLVAPPSSSASSSASSSVSSSASSSASGAAPRAPPPKGMLAMASSIARQEGVTRLFKGTECAVARQALCGGIGVGLYQPVRTVITGGSDSSTFLQKIAAASLTGTIGQLAAAPLDVIKVRLQADGRLELLGETPRYRGMGHAMVTIPREEGFAALYKGLTPSLGRAAIMYGTSCATYDQAKTTVVAMPGSTLRPDALATHMLCSGMSGLVAALVSCPFDVIKTRCVLRVGDCVCVGGWGTVVGYPT